MSENWFFYGIQCLKSMHVVFGTVFSQLGEGGGGAHATRNQQGTHPAHARPTEWGSVCGGRLGQRVEEQGTWASRTEKQQGSLWMAGGRGFTGQKC